MTSGFPDFRKFRRQLLLARRCLPHESLRFHFGGSSGGAGTLSLSIGSSEHEFAVAMQPFVDPDSELWLPRVWEQLKPEVETSIGKAEADAVSESLATWQRGRAGLNINGKNVRPDELFRLVWRGVFGNEPDALKLLGPNPPAFFFSTLMLLFFWVNRDALLICGALLDAMYRLGYAPAAAPPTLGPCIYCLNSAGPFTSEEHILPDSLIGDVAVLPVGTVCDSCNHELCSALDQALLDYPPIAFHRVSSGPLTKKGKFPRADLGTFTVERTGPSAVRIAKKDGAPNPIAPNPDDPNRLQITWKSDRPYSLLPLARALTKVALGFVAMDVGIDRARDSVFDDARAFIRGERGFKNNLILASQATFDPGIACQILDTDGASGALFSFFGIEFAISLRPVPVLTLSDDLRALGLYEWSLDRTP